MASVPGLNLAAFNQNLTLQSSVILFKKRPFAHSSPFSLACHGAHNTNPRNTIIRLSKLESLLLSLTNSKREQQTVKSYNMKRAENGSSIFLIRAFFFNSRIQQTRRKLRTSDDKRMPFKITVGVTHKLGASTLPQTKHK